jgi:saccharopine dehydrogenase (NAD+, L-lysine-forming)
VAGFHWFTDYIVMPAGFLLLKFSSILAGTRFDNFSKVVKSNSILVKPFAKILLWSLKTFSKPPFGTMLLLEATGWRGDQPATLRVTLFHEDAYLLTAAPVVACLLQYLEGGIRKAGLWCQANVVAPARMLQEVERLGIKVEIRGNK